MTTYFEIAPWAIYLLDAILLAGLIALIALGLTLRSVRADRALWRTGYETKAQENRLLREAIRDANVEIRKQRAILADIIDRESRETALRRIDEGKTNE